MNKIKTASKYSKGNSKYVCDNKKEVPLICGLIKDVNEKNNYPDCYTSMTNLTKIIILSEDKIKSFTLNKNVECFELPFSNIKTKSQPKQGIEIKTVATCGQYVRIVSKDLDEFGENFESKGYWVKISDTDMYTKNKEKSIKLHHINPISQFNENMENCLECCWKPSSEKGNNCCWQTCKRMLESVGGTTGREYQVQIATGDANCKNVTGIKKGLDKAVKYIDNSLFEDNLPVVVGVNYVNRNNKPCSGNIPKITDHFVLIVGKDFDSIENKYFYIFYEVGSEDNVENDIKNRLYIGTESLDADNNKKYKVTEFRINK